MGLNVQGFRIITACALVLSGCEFAKNTGVAAKLTSQNQNTTTIVTLAPPTSISYSANSFVTKIMTPVSIGAPTLAGGLPSSILVAPTLPDGLVIDSLTGAISGTPTTLTPAANYTIVASNAAGAAQTVLNLSVVTNVVPPANLTYSTPAPVLTNGIAITAITPSSLGGTPTAYTVNTPLPTGLVLNPVSGIISGTPTVVQAAKPYVISATNAGGSATATLSITVNEQAPATLTYSSNPASYKIATLITANTPATTGGVPTSYSISTPLPTGLLFNTATGVITGTPTVTAAATAYTIKAMNSAGSAQAVLNLSVVAVIVAPTGLAYSNMAPTFTKGVLIPSLTPTSSGGAPTSYAISAPLSAGLLFNTATGVISGTPTALSAATAYTVTATNSAGSTTTNLTVTVVDLAPASLSYSVNPAIYKVATLITPNTPTSTGGTPVSFSVTPALPAGLTLNTVTGVISGTPTAVTAGATYTLKATNTAGSAQASLTITVLTNVVAPANLSYGTLAPQFTNGTVITALSPTFTGGTPTSYAMSFVPAGLAFNLTTGVLSGTPSAAQPATSTVITAMNAGGSTSVTLTITVKDVPPATLVYSAPSVVYPLGTAIASNIAMGTGGAITAYALSPALPAGFIFNTTSGTISGTPTTATLPGAYTVTGSNSAGSVATTITIGVSDPKDPNATYAYISTNLISPRCISCHGTGSSFGNYTTYAGLLTGTVSGKPLSSPLFLRTAAGAASPMPPGGTITTVQSFAIMNWIAVGTPNSVTVTPSPTPSPSATTIASGTPLEPNVAQFRMTNRQFIGSAFSQIFGSSATSTVTNLILAKENTGTLGDPCNGYSDMNYDPLQGTPMKPSSDCDTQASAAAAVMPTENSGREALHTRACDLILSQDSAVLYAAGLALGTTVTTATIPAMTSTSIASAHALFFQGKPLDSTVATDLQSIATGGSSAVDGWRFVLLTLCYAPNWQIQ
jgi:hypothetical protein